jgi:hypothetical protein
VPFVYWLMCKYLPRSLNSQDVCPNSFLPIHSQRNYTEVKIRAENNTERDADALLLEPSSWNTYYRHLQAYRARTGHCNFKRKITDADVYGMSEEEEKELRTLSWWTCRQRKFKRRGELDAYKVHLLGRLGFEWNPHAGPGTSCGTCLFFNMK